MDADLNGMTDMVFYHNKKVYTIYNQLISKNYKDNELSDEQNLCWKPDQISNRQVFPSFNLTSEEIAEGGTYKITIQDLSQFFNETNDEIVDISNPLNTEMYAGKEYPFQGRLRIGDLNIDGYPEIFLTLVLKDKLNG